MVVLIWRSDEPLACAVVLAVFMGFIVKLAGKHVSANKCVAGTKCCIVQIKESNAQSRIFIDC